MLRKLNSTRTGSSHRPAPDYHIIYRDGMYKVFDKAQRFRCSFATPDAANAYIEQRTAKSHQLPEAA